MSLLLKLGNMAYSYTCNYIPVITLHRIDNKETRLMLWDTAGQEEFDAITKAYYRGQSLQLLQP